MWQIILIIAIESSYGIRLDTQMLETKFTTLSECNSIAYAMHKKLSVLDRPGIIAAECIQIKGVKQ